PRERLRHRFRLAEARLGEGLDMRLGRPPGFPQPVIAALRLVAEEDVVEQPSHGLAMPTPFRLEGFDARKAEAAGQRHPFRRIFRYFMRLRVVPLLQAVLQPAEEVI